MCSAIAVACVVNRKAYLALAEQLCLRRLLANDKAAVVEARSVLFEPSCYLAFVAGRQEVCESAVDGRAFGGVSHGMSVPV